MAAAQAPPLPPRSPQAPAPAPGDKLSLRVTCETGSVAAGERREAFVALATVGAAPQGPGDARAPIDLVAVVDTSGSMGGAKLELLRLALLFVASRLRASDRLGLVSFSGRAATVLPLSWVVPSAADLLEAKIRSLEASGSTNLSAGLLCGIKALLGAQPRTAGAKPVVRSVVLFTDGLAKLGITQTPLLVEAARNACKAAASNPVSMHAPPLN
eukprot:m51a1_g11348 hypothetical protein (214) ;mRNA; f:4414-5561